MTPVLIPCPQSAHDQNVLARRPQWDQHGCPSEGKKPNELAWDIKHPERATDRTTPLIWTLVRIVLPKNVSGIFLTITKDLQTPFLPT